MGLIHNFKYSTLLKAFTYHGALEVQSQPKAVNSGSFSLIAFTSCKMLIQTRGSNGLIGCWVIYLPL